METGKPRKTCVEMAGRRTFRTLPSRQGDRCGQHPKHVEWSCSKIKLSANSYISLVYYNIYYDVILRQKNGTRKICVLIFHCQSGATNLMNYFWHTWVRAVVDSVHRQVIYKARVCQCVGLASVTLGLFLTLFPGGILCTATLQQCHLIYCCFAWKMFILKQILDSASS